MNGTKVGESRVDKTILGRFSADETFDTGLDTGTPVSELYASPFKFTGKLQKLEIDVAPTNLSADDERQIMESLRVVQKAVE
jgi:arylsulfatase